MSFAIAASNNASPTRARTSKQPAPEKVEAPTRATASEGPAAPEKVEGTDVSDPWKLVDAMRDRCLRLVQEN